MRIKNYFRSLSYLQKVELYLIVFMFYFLIFMYHKEISNYVYANTANRTILNQIKKEVNILDKKQYIKLDHAALMNHIYMKSNKKNIHIIESQTFKNTMQIKLRGDYTNIIAFLNTTQNHFIINKFDLIKQDDTMELDVTLDTEFFYNFKNKKETSDDFPNPFYREKEEIQMAPKIELKEEVIVVPKKKEKDIEIVDIQIDAILSSEVLVNKNWYNKGDIVDNYKIISIQKKSVLLKNLITQEKITKKVVHE